MIVLKFKLIALNVNEECNHQHELIGSRVALKLLDGKIREATMTFPDEGIHMRLEGVNIEVMDNNYIVHCNTGTYYLKVI